MKQSTTLVLFATALAHAQALSFRGARQLASSSTDSSTEYTQGYIRLRHAPTKFLYCKGSDDCTFGTGIGGAVKFEPQAPDGENTSYQVYDSPTMGVCLSRNHIHHSTSAMSLGECDFSGAKYWNYEHGNGKLYQKKDNEDSNCVQEDGTLAHCSDKYAPVEFCDASVPKVGKGQWKLVDTGQRSSYSETYSVTNTYGDTTSNAFTQSQTSSKLKFKLGDDSGSAKSMSSTVTKSFQSSITEVLSETSSYTCTSGEYDGELWQWEWTLEDQCGVTTAMPCYFQQTNATQSGPPCCPPTYFKDMNDPHGECTTPEVNMCK